MHSDTNTDLALTKRAFRRRDFLTIHGDQQYCYWTGVGDLSVTVLSAITGQTELRTFLGDGRLLTTGRMVLRIGLEARSYRFTMSGVADEVRDMLLGGVVRGCDVEFHRGVADKDTGELVSTPFPWARGTLDAAPGREAIGSSSEYELSVKSVVGLLTRTSQLRESSAQQQIRHPGDTFQDWSASTLVTDVFWGRTA